VKAGQRQWTDLETLDPVGGTLRRAPAVVVGARRWTVRDLVRRGPERDDQAERSSTSRRIAYARTAAELASSHCPSSTAMTTGASVARMRSVPAIATEKPLVGR
jgi:hypothetical protein